MLEGVKLFEYGLVSSWKIQRYAVELRAKLDPVVCDRVGSWLLLNIAGGKGGLATGY